MVLKEIEGLESDIEKLRSQVQKGSRMIVESDDSTEDEFVPHQAYESRIQRVHQQHHIPMTHYDHHANGKLFTRHFKIESAEVSRKDLVLWAGSCAD